MCLLKQYGNTVDVFEPDANVWLDTGAVSLADKGNANVSDASSIMKFILILIKMLI